MAPWLLQMQSLREDPEWGVHQQVSTHLQRECGFTQFEFTRRLFFRDGFPYCERDYQTQFGVKCEVCHRFITGKVLEVRKVSVVLSPFLFDSLPLIS